MERLLCVWTFCWVTQNEQIHLLCVRILFTFPLLSPLVAVVICDDRGGADAPALGAVSYDDLDDDSDYGWVGADAP